MAMNHRIVRIVSASAALRLRSAFVPHELEQPLRGAEEAPAIFAVVHDGHSRQRGLVLHRFSGLLGHVCIAGHARPGAAIRTDLGAGERGDTPRGDRWLARETDEGSHQEKA
jgi:hypothetical protein